MKQRYKVFSNDIKLPCRVTRAGPYYTLLVPSPTPLPPDLLGLLDASWHDTKNKSRVDITDVKELFWFGTRPSKQRDCMVLTASAFSW